MKKFKRQMQLCSVLAMGLAMGAGPALAADSATETYDLEAVVGNTSTITNIAAGADNGLTFNAGTSTFNMDAATVDGADATFTGAGSASTITMEVMSNYASNISFKTDNDGMFVDAGDKISVVAGSAAFIESLDYTATLIGGPVVFNLTTAEGAVPGRSATQAIPGAVRSTLTMVVSMDVTPDNVPIVAGTYKDTLTLKVGATF